MNYQNLLISVDELWLRGKNRGTYVKSLKNHIVAILKALEIKDYQIVNHQQRFIISSESSFSQRCLLQLSKVPGIHAIVPSLKFEKDLDLVGSEVCSILEEKWKEIKDITFKVETQRVDKHYGSTSVEVSKDLGAKILIHFNDKKKLKVKMKNAEQVISLRIMPDAFYISFEEYLGVGGFPVGTNGKLVSLLSGGFDSPVSSFLMNQRGCQNNYIFFYSYPFVGEEVRDKIISITQKLAQFQKYTSLYIVPFGEIQKKIAKNCKESYRTIFFRKVMFETAAKLADNIKAEALITGDSLGQVSSQTITNLSLMDKFINMSIFRPLIGMTKRNIIEISKRIDIHDISVIPHDDACSLFSPKHPVIRSNIKEWNYFCNKNDFSEDINLILEQSEKIGFNCLGEIIQPK